ncbi:hypothetical protein SAMN05216387_11536 [Nitrosovibrio tenuis]|uniref:Uncharacterized protein n=1 Tax=Nitrosovibrio tenuis TaxID=1233 RepID=A0A1H7R730_9PROT|nr:hypothetical protein SAMN05216387_11536 [Nitrosovibrio tenuis]
MKDEDEGRQLVFDFSSQVVANSKRAIETLRLVYVANNEFKATQNLNNIDIRSRVLENLLKTRITKV